MDPKLIALELKDFLKDLMKPHLQGDDIKHYDCGEDIEQFDCGNDIEYLDWHDMRSVRSLNNSWGSDDNEPQ